MDRDIKEREDNYAFAQEYNNAFAQECIAERIVVLKCHHQEATKQCNELNRLHQEADKAENKSSNKYFSGHQLLHSLIVLTKASDKFKLRSTGSIQREINEESEFHESDIRSLTDLILAFPLGDHVSNLVTTVQKLKVVTQAGKELKR